MLSKQIRIGVLSQASEIQRTWFLKDSRNKSLSQRHFSARTYGKKRGGGWVGDVSSQVVSSRISSCQFSLIKIRTLHALCLQVVLVATAITHVRVQRLRLKDSARASLRDALWALQFSFLPDALSINGTAVRGCGYRG